MDYSREKLIDIWQRAVPGTPPPEVFDTLLYPNAGADGSSDGAPPLSTDDASTVDRAATSLVPMQSPAPNSSSACSRLGSAVDGELCLFAIYRTLAKYARSRRIRGLAREFDRLAADAYASARTAAVECYLTCGEYRFNEAKAPQLDSLRDGIRKAWTLERSLAKLYAEFGSEFGGDALMRICSAHSTKLRELLAASL